MSCRKPSSAPRPAPDTRDWRAPLRPLRRLQRRLACMADMVPFDWADPLNLEDQLTEDERMIRHAARGFAQDVLQPRVIEAFRDERDAPELFPLMGEAGLLGVTVPEEFGGA